MLFTMLLKTIAGNFFPISPPAIIGKYFALRILCPVFMIV